MNNATVNIDLKSGFAWAENPEKENLFQVCINTNGEIDANDSGWNWGLCGDHNSSLYPDPDNAEKAYKDFLTLADNQNIKVIGI